MKNQLKSATLAENCSLSYLKAIPTWLNIKILSRPVTTPSGGYLMTTGKIK